jgi:hypothetical protein
MADATDKPRVLSNDDGWVLGNYGPPITIDHLRDNMVGPHVGSPIDTFLWSVGGREVFAYASRFGEQFGKYVDVGDNPDAKVRVENIQHLDENHGGVVAVIAQLCHEAGMKFFPSMRMNTHYNTEESSPSFGEFRRNNPELLIGRPDDDIPFGTLHWGLRTGKDFAHQKVRQFMSDVCIELLEDYDTDGIELDFMRHPGNFRPEEAYTNRYLMTEMIRRIRQRMVEIGKAKGRDLELAVRVAASPADSLRLGLDAENWIKEGLVDIVITGLGFNPFNANVAGFVEAAEGTNCKILGCFEALRPVMDTEVLRAIAARYLDQGASGIYFFNFYSMDAEWKRDVVGELIDPVKLARLDKIYEIDWRRPGSPESQIGHAFTYAISAPQLPVQLRETLSDRGVVLSFDLSDDLDAADREGALDVCSLAIGFDGLADGDELEVTLNGHPLAWESRSSSPRDWTRDDYDGAWNLYPSKLKASPIDRPGVGFDVGPTDLTQGRNELEVRLVQRDASATEPFVIQEVRISIHYKG